MTASERIRFAHSPPNALAPPDMASTSAKFTAPSLRAIRTPDRLRATDFDGFKDADS